MEEHLMTLNEYQQEAMKTSPRGQVADKLTIATLGVVAGAGKLASPLKRFLVHKQAIDQRSLVKAFGAVLWFISLAADALGVSLEEVARLNLDEIAQLKAIKLRVAP